MKKGLLCWVTKASSLLWTTFRPEPRHSSKSDTGRGGWNVPLWERLFWEAAARKKGEKRQHPEHFKFISYIFTQLNQAQKQKKESHVSTSFPRDSPNIAGCFNSLPYVIILMSIAQGPGTGLRGQISFLTQSLQKSHGVAYIHIFEMKKLLLRDIE